MGVFSFNPCYHSALSSTLTIGSLSFSTWLFFRPPRIIFVLQSMLHEGQMCVMMDRLWGDATLYHRRLLICCQVQVIMLVHMCGTLTDSPLCSPFLSRTIASRFPPNARPLLRSRTSRTNICCGPRWYQLKSNNRP